MTLRSMMIVCLLAGMSTLSAQASQQLEIRPGAVSFQDKSFSVDLVLITEQDAVSGLPGIGFRLCWDENQIDVVSANFIESHQTDGDQVIGSEESAKRCQRALVGSSRMFLWSDLAAAWPESAELEVATLAFDLPDSYEGLISFWVEEVAVGPGIEFSSNVAEVRVLGDRIFNDRFAMASQPLSTGDF
jgi:hypothetical protein